MAMGFNAFHFYVHLQINFTTDTRPPISAFADPSGSILDSLKFPDSGICHSQFLDLLGLSADAQSQLQSEIQQWDFLPYYLSAELTKRVNEASYLQEYFLRLHRVLYFKYMCVFVCQESFSRSRYILSILS
jgi:hypothetical protein